MLSSLAFLQPLLLIALASLPIIWLLMRAVPPAPLRRRFPAITLLFGLKDEETTPDRTPWWLLLLRILAVAAVIVGFAGPVLNPQAPDQSSRPLVILFDASWASGPNWASQIAHADNALAKASRAGRLAAIVSATDGAAAGGIEFGDPDLLRNGLTSLEPNSWLPNYAEFAEDMGTIDAPFDTYWYSDGLAHDARNLVIDLVSDQGDVTVVEAASGALALEPSRFEDGQIVSTLQRSNAAGGQLVEILAIGPDPSGVERILARQNLEFEDGENVGSTSFDLPIEMRNRISRFEVAGIRSAGAVSLADDNLRRRKIVLSNASADDEAEDLLSPLHYVDKALAPSSELIEASVLDGLLTSPDVLVLADVADLGESETEAVEEWVRSGGLLLRFAGPKMAAATEEFRQENVLMPVRLRAGGRTIGGAMSWGEPRSLRPFSEGTPFFGLKIPEDVTVSSQVVAEPGPDLSSHVIARLKDGTPLVTQAALGEGQIVLFHVAANAGWSNLPLSGLFVEMLQRLSASARGIRLDGAKLEGQTWVPTKIVDGFGRISSGEEFEGVDGKSLAQAVPSADFRPGLYTAQRRHNAAATANLQLRHRHLRWTTQFCAAEDCRQPAKRLRRNECLRLRNARSCFASLLVDQTKLSQRFHHLQIPNSDVPRSARHQMGPGQSPGFQPIGPQLRLNAVTWTQSAHPQTGSVPVQAHRWQPPQRSHRPDLKQGRSPDCERHAPTHLNTNTCQTAHR